jgi:hypothetical protein
MLPLDPVKYLAETLKPYATGARPGLPGLFERYLLEPGDRDDTVIADRLADVKALWDKNLEHARYGELVRALAGGHDDACLALQDPNERKRLADELERSRAKEAAAAEEAIAGWRELLAEYVAAGGLTPATRASLERIAAKQGLDPALVRGQLDAAPEAAPPPVMDADTRRQIRKALQDLARVVGEERLSLSLFHALGLDGITDDLGVVERQYEKVEAQNRARTFGQTASGYKTVLALVRLHLLQADPRAYLEGLIEDIGADMEFEVARSATDRVIDPTEAEALLRDAMRRGLTDELARRLIADLARDHGARLEVGAAVDYVACPSCNTPHARPSAPDSCARCGTALFVDCRAPGCGARNDATASRCRSCGADLFAIAEATRRLAAIPQALREGRIGWAMEELGDVRRALGEEAIRPELRSQVADRSSTAQASWAEAEQAIAVRRLYDARRLLRELGRTASDLAGPAGDLPQARLAEVERRLQDVDRALVRARTATGDDREAALCEALSIAEDCDEAAAALEAIPPRPPGAVSVELGGGAPAVAWEPSETVGARYVIVRVDDGSGDRSTVATTDGARCEDRDAPTGATVRYEVATVRGRARSEPRRSEPLLVAREVRDLAIQEGDGEARLTWQPLPATARVLVRRTTEGAAGSVALTGGRAGFVDADVENGRRYSYRVSVEYDGRHETPGITAYAQPAPPPEGIETVELTAEAGGVRIGVPQPPHGTVAILRCDSEPETELGERLDPGALDGLGHRLRVEPGGALDASPEGVCWYLPVTLAGGVAIAGRAARHLALPAISNVSVVEAAGQFRLTWEWPEGVRLVRVVWRRDRQPLAPDEPDAESAWVRLGEYRDHGGFTIDADGSAALFTAVVAGLRTADGLVAGASIAKGARAAVRATAKTDLSYAVRRTGMRKRRLEVEVRAPDGASPPRMVLIARGGDLLPRSAAEGEVLAHVGGDAPLSSSVDLGGRERPFAVRLFLESSSSAERFQVSDPSVDELVVR